MRRKLEAILCCSSWARKARFVGRVLAVAIICLTLCERAAAGPPAGVPESAVRMVAEGLNVRAWVEKNRLYLEVPSETAGPEIHVPRLANVVTDVAWVDRTDSRLSLQPEPSRWILKPGAVPDNGSPVIVMTLDAAPAKFQGTEVISPDEQGILLLPAKFAVTHGVNVRYEPQAHKNTVGYWSNEKDTAHWQFEVKAAGKFEIDILQGCGKGHGGSDVELRVAGQTVPFQVVETGHFQNFVWRTVGTAELKEPGILPLQLVPVKKSGGAVMDVRAIRLVPMGVTRSFEPELADPQSLPKSESKILQ